MPPLMGTKGAASAQGFGFTLSSLSESAWMLIGNRTTNQTAGFDVTRGYAVSESGILATMSSYSGNTGRNVIRFFDKDGLSIKDTIVNSYYDGPTWGNYPKMTYLESFVNNNNLSAPIFYPVVSGNYYDPYGAGAFYHTTNTPVWTNNPWQLTNTGYNYGNSLQNLFTDSSNNAYIVPYNPTKYAGKYTAQQTMVAKISSSGAFVWHYRTGGNNFAPSSWQGANYGMLRTDGKLAVVGMATSALLGIYTTLTTGDINNTYNYNRQASCGTNGSAMIDSSNNIYIGCWADLAGNRPRLFRVNSAFAANGAYEYTQGGSTSSTHAGTGWDFYDGKLYSFANRIDDTQYSLTRIDAGTLDPDWTLNITITGLTSSRSTSYGNSKKSVIVTAEGIYLALFGTASNGVLISMVIKVPLSGDLTVSSKTMSIPGGASLTLSASKVTSGATMTTRTAITFTTGSYNPVSLSSSNWNTSLGTAPASFTSPTALTLTSLP